MKRIGGSSTQKKGPPATGTLTYEEARATLEHGDNVRLATLAKRDDARPEMLYYLAQKGPKDARIAAAKNALTPVQADAVLARDEEDEVRVELARKIGRILPDLSPTENAKLRDATIGVLDTLARDQIPLVREILADELKDATGIPKEMILRLAGDELEDVACPVLEYSPMLGDEDLRELIAAGLGEASLSAVARREEVSPEVSDAIASSLEVPAIAALLTNKNAKIREDTMDKIINQAEEVKALHRPLAFRSDLSTRAVRRIASFVASTLVETMVTNNALNEREAAAILSRVRKRLDSSKGEQEEVAKIAGVAKDLFDRGAVNDETIVNAVIANKRELAIHCLALSSGISPDNVRRIIFAKSPQAMTALSWKAGLRMRTAYELQTKLALIAPQKLLPAREGRYYPLSQTEMEQQLQFFS